MCDVCSDESCKEDVGVASIPGVPMSIMWGRTCLDRQVVVPAFVLEYFFDINEGEVNEWCQSLETWYDGRYMSYPDYIDIYRVAQGLGGADGYGNSL